MRVEQSLSRETIEQFAELVDEESPRSVDEDAAEEGLLVGPQLPGPLLAAIVGAALGGLSWEIVHLLTGP